MATANGPGVEERPENKSVKERRMERRYAARMEAIRQRANHRETIIEFQPDAVEIENRSVPGGASWTLYTVIALIISAVTWASIAKIDKIVVANGKLITVANPIVVQSVNTAPIRSINATFGDRVRPGDVLATLDPTFSEADLTALQARLNGLEATIARLIAERDGGGFSFSEEKENPDWMMEYQLWLERKQEYDAKMNEFTSQQNKLDVQNKNNEENIEMQQVNLNAYRNVEQRTRELHARGSASAFDLLSREIQRRQAETELMTSRSRRSELETEKDVLAKQKLAHVAGWRAKVAGELLQRFQERKALEQEINKAIRMNEFVELVVPTDTEFSEFEVLEVADLSTGSVLQSGEPLFKLIPVNAPLEAEIEILGKDIALVEEGSTVRVKLAAFPYQQHGTLAGEIRSISEDAFETETAMGPAINYRARVRLNDPVQLDNNENAQLSAGMTASAEVKVGKRRVIQYFLYPIIRAWDTFGREP